MPCEVRGAYRYPGTPVSRSSVLRQFCTATGVLPQGWRQRGPCCLDTRYRLDIVIWPWSKGPVHVFEPV